MADVGEASRFHSADGSSLVATSGLLCTGEQQVQGQVFEPIKGLYASGNCCGGPMMGCEGGEGAE